ncbi:MAG: DUF4215 domain-containing protein, partial [Polyangiaceae bacterium]|nr:DUF4215 domain-containing protein [Polyangiaceae bacterium]
PVLYIQQGTCGDAASSIWCADFNFPASPTTESIATAVTPGTYYVVVDGSAASGGTYTLNVNFTAAACGDGVVNVSEECDDGNALAGDGCANCSLETGQFEDCANPEVAPVSANTPIFLHGWTTANLDDLSGSTDCANSPAEGCGSNDRVVLVMPADSGTLTATIGMDKFNIDSVCATSPYPDPILDPACWDRVLYAYQGPNPATCGGPGYITLGAGVNLGDPVTISFPVVAGSSYFIVVDGYYGNDPPGYESGEYWLHLNLQ